MAIKLLRSLFLLAALQGAPPIALSQGNQYPMLTSPDGNVQVQLSTARARNPFYSITYHGRPVIAESQVDIKLNGAGPVGIGKMTITDTGEVDQTYPYRGVKQTARDHHKFYHIDLETRDPFPARLEFRVFNNAVAYRWVFTGDSEVKVEGDYANWELPWGTELWLGNDLDEGLFSNFEVGNIRQGMDYLRIATAKLTGEDPLYLFMSEAGVFEYNAGRFTSMTGLRTLTLTADGVGTRQPGESTPWRFTVISPDLNGLVNSTTPADLCPPPDPELFPQGMNTAWIETGRAVWTWGAGGRGAVNPDDIKEYTRLAGELGWEFSLVDDPWEDWEDKWERLREIVAIGKEQDVRIWVWRPWNAGLTDEAKVDEFFGKLRELDVAGIKTDFGPGANTQGTRWASWIARKAAEHQLMINYHGAHLPSGTWRTLPNEMTRESVFGAEHRNMSPRHSTIIPFTRGLIGPMDYTPMALLGEDGGRPTRWYERTTEAHQIASAVIFTSPVQHFVTSPQIILAREELTDVVKNIAADWDETRVLPQSEIGEVAVFARRKGDGWYLAALNGNAGQTLKLEGVSLDFLGDGQFRAVILKDSLPHDEAAYAEKRHVVVREETDLTPGSTVDIEMLPGGGWVAMIVPAP